MATARETRAQAEEPPVVFVSYSRHDKIWKDQLLGHLGVLEKAGLISAWSDDDIDKGGEWLPPLVKAMKDASVAVCLISHHYLNTDFCVKHEIPYLIERAEEEGLHLLFFMVSPADYAAHRWLAERQWFLPKGQCVEIDFAGRENLPFSWLVKDIRERLGEHVQAQEEPAVSDYIRQALAALDAEAASMPEPEPMPVVEAVESAFSPIPEACIDIERLPVTGKELFGRQFELQVLDDAWASDSTNIVALTAWGGVGKSTLVNRWVERLGKDNYRGAERVFAWSFYSQGMRDQVTSADAFIDEALRFFGDDDPSEGSPWAKGERLAELVGKQKALLLLDGMEPLQDSYQGIKDPALARLVECLAVDNAGLCVITTREKVKELDDDDLREKVVERHLEQISPEAGRALLRVKRVRGSDTALEQASRDFGNHALAINLLASYLQFYDNRHISKAATISDLPNLEDPHHRHPRRVMAAFADRFGDSPALDVLHMIGLFDQPADAGCIAALRGEPAIPGLTDKLFELDEIGWQNLLDELRNFGLLAPRNEYRRGELDAHPLVREHFGVRLRAEREDAWKAGHKRLYEHLKESQEIYQPNTLAGMAPLFQAVHHGCQAGQHEDCWHTVFNDRITRGDEGYLVHQLSAFSIELELSAFFFDSLWDQPSIYLQEFQRARILGNTAFLLRAVGRLEDSITPNKIGLGNLVEQRNWRVASTAALNLSELYLDLGKIAMALNAAQYSVEYAAKGAFDYEKVQATVALAATYHYSGEIDKSSNLFRDAERLLSNADFKEKLLFGIWSYKYCDLLLDNDRIGEVVKRGIDELKIRNTSQRPLEHSLINLSLGRAALMKGNRDEAGPLLDEVVGSLRQVRTIHHIPRGLLARAAFFRDMKKFGKSRKDLKEVMRIATRSSMRLHECDAHLEYARLILAEGGSQADARASLDKAEALVRETGYHRRDGEVAELKEELGP